MFHDRTFRSFWSASAKYVNKSLQHSTVFCLNHWTVDDDDSDECFWTLCRNYELVIYFSHLCSTDLFATAKNWSTLANKHATRWLIKRKRSQGSQFCSYSFKTSCVVRFLSFFFHSSNLKIHSSNELAEKFQRKSSTTVLPKTWFFLPKMILFYNWIKVIVGIVHVF